MARKLQKMLKSYVKEYADHMVDHRIHHVCVCVCVCVRLCFLIQPLCPTYPLSSHHQVYTLISAQPVLNIYNQGLKLSKQYCFKELLTIKQPKNIKQLIMTQHNFLFESLFIMDYLVFKLDPQVGIVQCGFCIWTVWQEWIRFLKTKYLRDRGFSWVCLNIGCKDKCTMQWGSDDSDAVFGGI